MNQQEIINWMSKNPKQILADLEEDIEKAERMARGLNKVKDSVLSNSSDENTRKQLHITMKSLAISVGIIKKLALINMVLVSGQTFNETPDFLKDNPAMADMFGGIFNK